MIKSFFIFFILALINVQNIIAQTFPEVKNNFSYNDSTFFGPTFLTILNKYDFSIAIYCYGMATPISRECNIIANKDGKWYQFYSITPLKYKWKGGIKMGKLYCRFLDANQDSCRKIFNDITNCQLISMNEDSLNNHRCKVNDGYKENSFFEDASGYIILISHAGNIKRVQCYAPYEYYECNPTILQRKKFVDFLNSSRLIWPKETY